MSRRKDVAQGLKKIRGVEEETPEKAVAHVLPGEGIRSLWVMGELVTYKIPSHRTSGAYALFEVVTHPGAGSPPHIQHREDESFYVLEGEFEFLSGEETIRAGAGSLLYVPKGTLHAHKNVGEVVGRLLVSQTPGGLYELFFEQVGKAVEGNDTGPFVFEDQLDLRKIVEVAAEHGTEIPVTIAQQDRPTNTTERGEQ